MSHLYTIRYPLAVWAVLTGLSGCGDGAKSAALYPVTGTIMADGKPLASAEVQFIPTGNAQANMVYGRTDEAGKYSLKTGSGKDGAPAGAYRVTVSKRINPDGTPYIPTPGGPPPIESPAKETVAPAQSDPGMTKLTASVSEGGGKVDLEVQLLKKK